MNHDDERDYAEEAANRADMEREGLEELAADRGCTVEQITAERAAAGRGPVVDESVPGLDLFHSRLVEALRLQHEALSTGDRQGHARALQGEAQLWNEVYDWLPLGTHPLMLHCFDRARNGVDREATVAEQRTRQAGGAS